VQEVLLLVCAQNQEQDAFGMETIVGMNVIA
jgi:hypothetical protein